MLFLRFESLVNITFVEFLFLFFFCVKEFSLVHFLVLLLRLLALLHVEGLKDSTEDRQAGISV